MYTEFELPESEYINMFNIIKCQEIKILMQKIQMHRTQKINNEFRYY